MRIPYRSPGLLESEGDWLIHRLTISECLSHTLEYEDIGIDRETYREYHTCYRGKSEYYSCHFHEGDEYERIGDEC